MDIIFVLLFITGLCFGSFYSVVATRLPNNESIIFPGSHCTNCYHRLSWYELIPVFSFILLRGKCKKCHKKISIEYPLYELITGLLFAFSYYIFGLSIMTPISIVVVSMVILTFISDSKYMVILDEVLIPSLILIIILYFIGYGVNFTLWHILYGIITTIILLLVKLWGDRAFKTESLGWGDIKLTFFAGLLLGVKLGIVYLFLGAFIALPYGIYTSIKKKDNLLPFGPFLVISLLILFWNIDLVNNILNFILHLN